MAVTESNGLSVTAVTSLRPIAAHVQYMTTRASPSIKGEGAMFWRKSAIFTMDCAAVCAGLLIASPFFLILASPFIVGF